MVFTYYELADSSLKQSLIIGILPILQHTLTKTQPMQYICIQEHSNHCFASLYQYTTEEPVPSSYLTNIFQEHLGNLETCITTNVEALSKGLGTINHNHVMLSIILHQV